MHEMQRTVVVLSLLSTSTPMVMMFNSVWDESGTEAGAQPSAQPLMPQSLTSKRVIEQILMWMALCHGPVHNKGRQDGNITMPPASNPELLQSCPQVAGIINSPPTLWITHWQSFQIKRTPLCRTLPITSCLSLPMGRSAQLLCWLAVRPSLAPC